MSNTSPSSTSEKIKHPIGIKLIVIISIMLLFSLGTITILVSAVLTQDVRITAETNNYYVNRRSAQEAESYFGMIRGNTLVLLDTLNALGTGSSAGSLAADYFFERNQDIAYIGIARRISNTNAFNIIRSLYNEKFFFSNELNMETADDFLANHSDALTRCSNGETLILNAAPYFDLPILAMLYPYHESGQPDAAVMFFSASSLTENFNEGTNQSYMVNDSGDYIIHADFELIRAGAASTSVIVTSMLDAAEHNRQTLFLETDGKQYFGVYKNISYGNASVITTIPYDLVVEGIRATTRRNVYLTGAVLFIAIIFVRLFSNTISKPLKTLASAASQIESGDFDLNLTPKTKDEIGYLTESFQKMGGALNIFGRFTNKEVAVKAMKGEIKPGGLPKHATIFFSDIRSFTAKSENFTKTYGEDASDKIIHWLNIYFTKMVECVEFTKGVVDKFIGDAVMAHWGTAYSAGSPAKDAFNCVKAALMMREALYEMNKDRAEQDTGNPPIQIGCGINTGIVTAGQLGSDRRMEYTVIGDPVNLASRVEALNKPMGTDILISEDTYKFVSDFIIAEEMPPVTVKGKEKPVRIFAVVNLKGAPGPKTLDEVRKMLGIEPPDLSKVDTGEEEKKYKIGSAN